MSFDIPVFLGSLLGSILGILLGDAIRKFVIEPRLEQ